MFAYATGSCIKHTKESNENARLQEEHRKETKRKHDLHLLKGIELSKKHGYPDKVLFVDFSDGDYHGSDIKVHSTFSAWIGGWERIHTDIDGQTFEATLFTLELQQDETSGKLIYKQELWNNRDTDSMLTPEELFSMKDRIVDSMEEAEEVARELLRPLVREQQAIVEKKNEEINLKVENKYPLASSLSNTTDGLYTVYHIRVGGKDYAGYTSRPFEVRMGEHLVAANDKATQPLHFNLRDANFKYIVVSTTTYTNKVEALLAERDLISSLPADRLNGTSGGEGSGMRVFTTVENGQAVDRVDILDTDDVYGRWEVGIDGSTGMPDNYFNHDFRFVSRNNDGRFN